MSFRAPGYDADKPLRRHLPADDWRMAMTEIANRHGLAGAPLAAFSSGSDVVWRVGDAVVKLTAPVWAEELDTEVRALATVRGRLPVETPEPLARGELDGWPYVVVSFVGGDPIGAVWPELDARARLAFAHELGALTATLHGLDAGEAWPDDWDAFRTRYCGDVRARHARGDVPAELLREIEPFLARLSGTGPLDANGGALLHTELLHEHILVTRTRAGARIRALIDFADARVGPPGYEFLAPAEFVFKGEPGAMRTMLQGYGMPDEALTPELAEELCGWALRHRFGKLERALAAVAPFRPSTLGELAQRLYGVVP